MTQVSIVYYIGEGVMAQVLILYCIGEGVMAQVSIVYYIGEGVMAQVLIGPQQKHRLVHDCAIVVHPTSLDPLPPPTPTHTLDHCNVQGEYSLGHDASDGSGWVVYWDKNQNGQRDDGERHVFTKQDGTYRCVGDQCV
jgi:hypothetical protein